MQFWTPDTFAPLALTALILFVLLRLVRRMVATRLPASLPAGVVAMALGPALLGWLPLSSAALELFVYHGLGLVFLTVAVSPRQATRGSRDARRLSAMIPAIGVLQALVGVATVAVLYLAGQDTHMGLGMLLPLGFNQGPGQALSMGRAWEASGLVDGGAMGLVIAALGFGGCCAFGLALIRGREGRAGATGEVDSELPGAPLALLVRVVVGYALTAAIVFGLAELLAGKPQLQAMIFGFHFLVALLVGTLMRMSLSVEGPQAAALRSSGSRFTSAVVDFSTTAALAAVSVELLGRHWLLLGLMTGVATLVTLGVAFGLRGGFDDDRFEHALLLFGTCTGTLLTGLALLRGLDPELRSAAPENMVTAAGGAAILGAPLLLVVMPHAITAWVADPAWALTSVSAALIAYLAVLLLVGRALTRGCTVIRPAS